jgi:hypothetical protein
MLHNLRTDQRIRLPDSVLVGERPRFMVMNAATLCVSRDQGELPSFGAAISCIESIDEPALVVWQMGSHVATNFDYLGNQAEDVICHLGSYHALSQDEEIFLVYHEIIQDDEMPFYMCGKVHANPRGGARGQPNVRARYLVQDIHLQLLMVVRFSSEDDYDSPTTNFRVFRQSSGTDESGLSFRSWEELHNLGGQILFVGHCSSRAYDVAKYPGFTEGIYFLEDYRAFDSFWNHSPPDHPSTFTYPWADNGKFLWIESLIRPEDVPASDESSSNSDEDSIWDHHPSHSSPALWIMP